LSVLRRSWDDDSCHNGDSCCHVVEAHHAHQRGAEEQ
jgi:hypothetical protein